MNGASKALWNLMHTEEAVRFAARSGRGRGRCSDRMISWEGNMVSGGEKVQAATNKHD